MAVAAAPTATATTLTVTPGSGTSQTDFKLTAKVLPIPDSGNVRITAWSAQNGGYVTWDHTFVLNESGVAVVNYVQIDAGTSWWQAEYLGNAGYAPSASPRTSVNVTGNPVTMTDAQITWSDSSISGRATIAQAGYQNGRLEIVIDGETYATCVPLGGGAGCTVPNLTSRGAHSAFLRYIPSDGRYANGISQTWNFYTGALLPPSAGMLIDGDAFSTRSLSVRLDIGTSGESVDLIKVSNSEDGLDGASETSYTPNVAWQLTPGADGYRTVYAKVHLAAGDWSTDVISDSIFLDTTAPTGEFVINNDDPGLGSAWGDNGIDSDQYLTGSVTDNTLGEPGAAVTNYAVSTDCRRYVYGTMGPNPDDFQATVSIFGSAWGSGVADEGGNKTFCAMWRDAAGNWSEPATDSIRFNWNLPVGHLEVNGVAIAGAPNAPPYVSATTVDLKIVVDEIPPEGVKSIKVYGNNGNPDENSGPNLAMNWPAGATSITIPWSITNTTYGYTAKDGIRNIAVRFLTNDTRAQWIGGMTILDRVVPTSDSPATGFALDTTVVEAPGGDGFGATAQSLVTTLSTDVQWKGSDATGIKSYDLDRLLNGAWMDVTLPKPTATTARQSVSTGTTNQFRVKATDLAGNTGAWKTGASFSALVVQETSSSIVYSGKWTVDSRSDALGGSLKQTKVAGASAKLTFTGRAIAIVAPRSSGAAADIYVDGNKIKTVQVPSATYQARRIVFSMSWKSKGTHTIKIVKKYVNSRAFPIDALLVLN